MATLTYYSGFSFTSGSDVVVGGSRTGGYSITVDGRYQRFSKSLATSTTWTPWTATTGTDSLTDFDFLWILSDQNVYVELTADTDATYGAVVFACEIQANIPFVLSSDDAYANYTANFATGTADVIDRLRIRNVSGSTAVVTGILVT